MFRVFLFAILAVACSKEPKTLPQNPAALELTQTDQSMTLEGELLIRNDLPQEQKYVRFRAFEFQMEENQKYHISSLNSQDDCPEKAIQISFRRPGSFQILSTTRILSKNQALNDKPLGSGRFILTLAAFSPKPCSKVSVSLTLSSGKPPQQTSAQPLIDRPETKEALPNEEERPLEDPPNTAPELVESETDATSEDEVNNEDLAAEDPVNEEQPPFNLAGIWDIEKMEQGVKIRVEYDLSTEKEMERRTYRNSILSERIIYDRFMGNEQFSLRVTGTPLFRADLNHPVKGDEFFCNYQGQDETLKLNCQKKRYPESQDTSISLTKVKD